MPEPTGSTGAEATRTYPSDPGLLARAIQPYRSHCKYLGTAVVRIHPCATGEAPRIAATGTFEIPESCYIDDTGHFNSVEFNICYNQLLYYTLAKTVQENLADPFRAWSMDDFWSRQLPDVLITDFRSSFRSPLRGRRFTGFLEITEISEWEGSDLREPLVVLRTECGYSDASGGECTGTVTIAITNPPVRGAPEPAGTATSGPEPAGTATSGPAPAGTATAPAGEMAERLAALPGALRRDELLGLVTAELRSALLMTEADDLPTDASFFDLGLTSLRVVEVKRRLETALGRGIESATLFNSPNVRALMEHLTTTVLPDLFTGRPPSNGSGIPASSVPEVSRKPLVDELLTKLYGTEPLPS